MKKIIAAAMVLCMMLVLVACSKKEKNFLTGYVSGDVTLGRYKGLTYIPKSTEVSEETIQRQFDGLISLATKNVEVTDRTDVRDGDVANIDYVGTKDGVAFEGGTSEGYDLEIGSGKFIEGFEAGLIGANVGDTVVLDLTFPEDYSNTELAGQAVKFEVKINSIEVKEVPELTDELVAENTDFDTIAEYRDTLVKYLTESLESEAASDREYQIVENLIANSTINRDITEEIDKATDDLIKQYDSTCQQQYGADAKTVFYYMYGLDEAAFNQYMRESAEMNTKYAFIVSAIAEAEKLDATEEEIDALEKEMLTTYNCNIRDELYAMLKTQFGKDGRTVVTEQVKLNKAAAIVSDNAVAVEE